MMLCRIARRLCDPLNIGRVIARPFLGANAEGLRAHVATARTLRCRRRTAISCSGPPAAGRAVVSIGKIGDIFAHRDTGDERKGKSNDGNVDLLIDALATAPRAALIFVNLVDFDTEWGHRRDVPGYAACLEAFDRRLGAIEAAMRPHRLLRHHRRPRQRPDLPGLRSYPRARANSRLWRRRGCRSDRRALKPRRRRRDDRGQARPAGRPWAAPGRHELRSRRSARAGIRSSSATCRSVACC